MCVQPSVRTFIAFDNIDRQEEVLSGAGTSRRVNGFIVQPTSSSCAPPKPAMSANKKPEQRVCHLNWQKLFKMQQWQLVEGTYCGYWCACVSNNEFLDDILHFDKWTAHGECTSQLNYQPSKKSCGSLFLYDQLTAWQHCSCLWSGTVCKGNINCMETSITVWGTEADDGELPFNLKLAVHNW